MIQRNLLDKLDSWAQREHRKPLVIRGARQVGKTTLVSLFGKRFKQYLYFNLERSADRQPFAEIEETQKLVDALFFLRNADIKEPSTLIFIDELQAEPKALMQLRYFLEEFPELRVIAAGSLLEFALDQVESFPVGRVEYMALKPLTFQEFLMALGETAALKTLQTIPVPDYAEQRLSDLFQEYVFVGGMPEIVHAYSKERSRAAIDPLFDALLQSFLDDIEKYGRTESMRQVLRHVIKTAFSSAASRITYDGFGKSNYKAREVGEALRTLEKAQLLQLVHPTVESQLPLQPDQRKSPKLFMLDTGMVNHFAGIQAQLLLSENLNSAWKGRVAEHITGQILQSKHSTSFHKLLFWVRDKKGSSAEIDFLHAWNGEVIPIEVNAGATGKLRSLHPFMDQKEGDLAVRVYSGALGVDLLESPKGKTFKLLNLPFYGMSELDNYLAWAAAKQP